ncbi:MAG: chloride channel protein [Thermoplasmata archaeon]
MDASAHRPLPYVTREVVREYLTLSSLAALIGAIAAFLALGFRYLLWVFISVFHNGGMLFGAPWVDPGILNLDATFFYTELGSARLILILILPLAGLLVGLIIHYLAPEVRGAGVAQVMEANLAEEGRMRPRTIGLKSLASALTVGSGASAGREGPIIQIGAASGSALGLANAPRKILVACAAAGAIAATFNAPIAGVLFALELILLELRTRSFIPLVISSVFASAVIGLFLPRAPLFPATYALVSPVELGFFILLGLAAGLFAVFWIRVRFALGDAFARVRLPPYLIPALGAAIMVPLAIFVPQVMGAGYQSILAVVNGTLLPASTPLGLAVVLLLFLGFVKMLATGLTLGSGGSGGGFSPSLFMGAMLGAAMGLTFNAMAPGTTSPFAAYAIVGMGALLAGATRATLTSILIVFELTGDFQFIVPVMLAAVVADGVSILLQRDTLYTGVLRRKGILFEHDIELNVLRTVRVREAMVAAVDTVREDTPVQEVGQKMITTGHQGFPVVDELGLLVGIITHEDVRRALAEFGPDTTVREVETQRLIVVNPMDSLEVAMERMSIAGIGHLPVVRVEDPREIVGILSRGDILRAYRRKALEERHEVFRHRGAR